MLSRRPLASLMTAGLTLAVSLVAGAATQTASFQVRVVIESMCTISATNMEFGSLGGLDPVAGNSDATSTLTVTCTPETPYQVGLDQGNVSGSTIENRLMSSGTAQLQFQLYEDSNRTDIWGNTPGNNTFGDTGTGSAQTLTVYGRIPAGQGQPAPGTYTSLVQAAITY